MSSAASAKWSLVSDPGEQGSGIWFLSEPGLTTHSLSGQFTLSNLESAPPECNSTYFRI